MLFNRLLLSLATAGILFSAAGINADRYADIDEDVSERCHNNGASCA